MEKITLPHDLARPRNNHGALIGGIATGLVLLGVLAGCAAFWMVTR